MKTYLFTLIVIAFLAAFCDADAGGETGSSKILAEIPAATLQQNMIWMEAAPTSEGEPIFVAFRKTFALDAQPNTAELRIFADLRYQLWVNGRYIVRGPVRFDPKAPQFDVLDIASDLKPGTNSLAVMVLSRARDNAMMRHVPGFTAELRLTDASGKVCLVKTDESWRWNDKTSYQTPMLKYNQGTWSDRVDARILGDEWKQPAFDDSQWRTAQKTDGTLWGPIRPRTMALLSQTPVPAKPVAPENYPVSLPAGKTVVFQAEKMIQGHLVVELDAEEGSQIAIEPALRFNGTNVGETYEFKTLYITKAGRQTYMSSGSYGCRYVAITTVKGNATVRSVILVDRRYPYTDAGSFTSSDPFLDELWKRAVHTMRMLSEDGYLDSALREQNEWMADAVAAYPVTRVALASPDEPYRSDPELMKNLLRHIKQSQLSDGRILAHHPSQSVDIHAYIEDYCCVWVEGIRQVYENTGDKELVREMWPALVKQIDWFLVRRTHHGLVFAREFVCFDNPIAYKYCEGATLNAFVYKALVDSACLGDVISETNQAAAYRVAAVKLAQSFNENLWNDKQGTYNAGIIDFKPAAPSFMAALFAINRGLVPEDRRASVTKYMLANTDKLGLAYAHYWLFEEQYRANKPELDLAALKSMRSKWAEVMKRTDTGTLTESYNSGEACHTFGAVPAYFLSAYVLGARVDGPVWNKHLLIEPRPGDLTYAEGVVVTELGLVPVEWKREAGSFTLDFTIPVGANATVRVPSSGPNDKLTLNGKSVAAKVAGRYLEVEVATGKHTAVLTAAP